MSARAAGERALLLDADGWSPPALAASVTAAAGAAGLALEDVVPGAATVLVVVGAAPDVAPLQALAAALVPPAPGGPPPAPAGRVEIPVTYDGADLDEVARATGLSPDEVVAAHQEATYVATFCGFAPGFAYLDGLPERLRLPRRPSPRTAVPPGAVAIADRYSAVYPAATPGGWHLLGRTSVAVWDPQRRPPALLVPGTAVRFVAEAAGAAPHRRPTGRRRPPAPAPRPPGTGALEVVDPGLLTTVQDAGRPGLAHQGVGPSGWLDPPAATLANRLVGNQPGAAVLEATVRGPALVLHGPEASSRAVAVTGGDAEVTVQGRPVALRSPVEVGAGARIEVRSVVAGARAYLAVSGGLAVEPVLGSCATDLLSGLGPPPLAVGQWVPLGPDHGRRSAVDVAPVAARPGAPVLRVVAGPRADWLLAGTLAQLVGRQWTVGPDSNRIGLRLRGGRLARAVRGELPPEGLVTGAVQVPPSGEPVVFLADRPVTGGYPVVAVVVGRDLALAGQLRPGATVGFTLVG